MTRLEKIQLAINNGWTCDPNNGIIYSKLGRKIDGKSSGYIKFLMTINKVRYKIYAHQFIYYWVNNKIVDQIDHIDNNKLNNCINNLRECDNSKNQQNRKDVKGYTNYNGKYVSQIQSNKNHIYLGVFNTKEEASKAYLDAKKIYHNI